MVKAINGPFVRPTEHVMNASARLIYRAPKFCHITALLAELHWLLVRTRIYYKILLITYKILHGHAPKYLSDLINIQQLSCYSLRHHDNGPLLERPFVKTKKTMGDVQSISDSCSPLMANKLPRSAREVRNLESFETITETFLFQESFQLF